MKTLFFVLLAVGLFAAAAQADSIYFKDGKVLHGTVLKEDDKTISLETCETQQIDKSSVESIRKDERGPKKWETILKIAADVAGRNSFSNVKISGTNLLQRGDSSIDPGTSLTAEEIYYVLPTLGIGGGISYQSSREEPVSGGKFNFVPIYGLVRLRSEPTGSNTYAYATAHLGYNYFIANKEYAGAGNFEMTNGAYAGLGAGYVFGRMQVEVLYTVDQGRLSGNDLDSQGSFYTVSADATYSKISLSIGYLF